MAPNVKCTAGHCTHYMPGDQCMAAKISIYNNETTAEANSSKDTECKSFHARKTVGDMVGALHNANVGGTISAAFVDGMQITPEVECFVNDCTHWRSNTCSASAINVVGERAQSNAETDCLTFERK